LAALSSGDDTYFMTNLQKPPAMPCRWFFILGGHVRVALWAAFATFRSPAGAGRGRIADRFRVPSWSVLPAYRRNVCGFALKNAGFAPGRPGWAGAFAAFLRTRRFVHLPFRNKSALVRENPGRFLWGRSRLTAEP
jgi:hypothetical protein